MAIKNEKYTSAQLRADPVLFARVIGGDKRVCKKDAKPKSKKASVAGQALGPKTDMQLLQASEVEAALVECFVGVDPGINTGIAIRDVRAAIPLQLLTLDFWKTVELLLQLHEQHDTRLLIVIENPALKRTMFTRYDKSKEKGSAYYAQLAQKVGQNMAHAQLLIQFCKNHGITVDEISPLGKYDAQLFARITGITTGSQHSRDAARLILER